MNRQHILSRLGRQHSILYSNGPWTIWDRKQAEYQRAPVWGAFRKQDNVHVDHPPRLLLSYPLQRRWDRTVRFLACARWRRRLESLPGEGLIAYVTHPDYSDYALGVRPDLIVYSPFDLFSATPGWTQDQVDREERLLRACDVVITVSDAIKSRLEPKSKASVFCVPNGVDAEAFAAGLLEAVPDDIAEIPRPRIGYVGSLNRKVDFGLVARLASSNPVWHFVFIGASFGHDENSHAAMECCRRLPNVHFLGMKPTPSLPRYMGALDVGMMCYLRGTWAEYGYPLKLHEYLAAGLPIVSTALPLLRDLRGVTLTPDGDKEWSAAISESLMRCSLNEKAARQQIARQNSWDTRVTLIDRIVTDAFLRSQRGSDSAL